MAVPVARQILGSDQSAGSEFEVRPGGHYQILLQGHAGGTWQLQVRSRTGAAGGTWISLGTDGEFDGDGMKSMFLNPECGYRISGGDMGAQAFCIPINGGEGPY